MSGFYWVNHTQKMCMGVESKLLYTACVVSAELKVNVVECC